MDLRIRRHQDQTVLNGLGDQHPIKRVAMVIGLLGQVPQGFFRERQGGEAATFSPTWAASASSASAREAMPCRRRSCCS